MAFCRNCGTKYEEGVRFCPSCGEATGDVSPSQQTGSPQVQQITSTQTAVSDEAKDARDNKVMGILAYILVLIPLLAAPKDSKFARFHNNQGLILLILTILYGIVFSVVSSTLVLISWQLALAVSGVLSLVGWVFPVFCILGIVNVCKGEMKPLPLIGKFHILKM